jgi:hypothetical protein
MTRILVCDDERTRATDLSQRIRRLLGVPELEVEALLLDDFIAAIVGLEDRQRAARDGKPGSDTGGQVQNPIDHADVLFVDYDLLKLGSSNGLAIRAESGERVCYLARVFSDCGIIIGYNQFRYNRRFDLTLRGHIRSFADLNITMDVAASRGFWTDDYTGFRPWSWPMLRNSYDRLNRVSNSLAECMAQPVLEILGLADDRIYDRFTREQLELLSPTKDPRTVTFEDFVYESAIGLRPRDKTWAPHAAARVAAARLSKWLERSVLPDQNIIVDAPHLISRFPSLIGEPHTEEHWNNTCMLLASVEELGIDTEKLRPYRFKAEDWLSRPAWLWPDVALDSDIPEVRDPWAKRPDHLVFCEDVSRFRRRRQASEFVAEVAPEFARRYVQRLKQVTYEPTVRFLM